jgi:hypothetical protein
MQQSPVYTKGEGIFKILDNIIRFELDLQWESCVSVTTDGITSMTSQQSSLLACTQKINPKISWQHCIIHEQSLVMKKMTPDLHKTLNICGKVIFNKV